MNNMNDIEMFDKIEFTNFNFYQDGTGFECTVNASDHEHSDIIFFRFDKSIGVISNNLVFGALMTLVGKKWYKNAYFDLSISKHVYDKAIELTKTLIEVKDFEYVEDADMRSNYDGNVLNLSGGMDSNALFYLLTRGEVPFHAIGTNFGSSYARDSEVCNGRVELTMYTNIRDDANKYVSDKKTWMFIGIASILSIDYFKTKHIMFGQVNQYDRYLRMIFGDNRCVKCPKNQFLSIVDCELYGIQFLTEFQTTAVVLDNVKDVNLWQKIQDASATEKHRGKFFRKQMFILAANKLLGLKDIDYSKYKFIDETNKFHKRFIEDVNSVTLNDKNMVLVFGLKYIGYELPTFKNDLFDKVSNFSFIQDVYQCDIPQFYQRYPKLLEYLGQVFNFVR